MNNLIKPLSSSAASLPDSWMIGRRPGWKFTARVKEEEGACDALEIELTEAGEDQLYVRARFELELSTSIQYLLVSAMLRSSSALGLKAHIRLSKSSDFEPSALKKVIEIEAAADGFYHNSFRVDLNDIPPGYYFGFIQIQLPSTAPAMISVAELRATPIDTTKQLRFHFSTVGAREQASSRLRAWMIGDQLTKMGHIVDYNKSDLSSVDYDIFVFQKVMPSKLLPNLSRSNSLLVYDFDDHFGSADHGSLQDLLTFFDGVDLVTCGSSVLVDFAAQHHPRAHLFENPVDLIGCSSRRQPTGQLRRIGWFGAPEGLVQLELAEISHPLTTITRGGDIEFDINTVDRQIAGFDLCVFPLKESGWNLAKNANRAIKALALGVPVLASATPEHRRIFNLAGLDDKYLVAPGESWDIKIAALESQIATVELEIDSARSRILQAFNIGKVTTDWLDCVTGVQKRKLLSKKTRQLRFSPSTNVLKNISAIAFDFSDKPTIVDTVIRSEVDWDAFGSRFMIQSGAMSNEQFGLKNFAIKLSADPSSVYSELENAICMVETPNILLLPPNYILKHGIVQFIIDTDRDFDLVALRSNKLGDKPDFLPTNIFELSQFASNPANPGPLLVKTEWLKCLSPCTQLLGFYSWYLVMRAFGKNFSCAPYSLSLRVGSSSIQSASDAYAGWLRIRQPRLAAELPNVKNQWERISLDVLNRVFEESAREWHPMLLSNVVLDNIRLKARLSGQKSL